jgi:hypothetical protein
MVTDSILQTKIEKLEEVKDYLSHSMQGNAIRKFEHPGG